MREWLVLTLLKHKTQAVGDITINRSLPTSNSNRMGNLNTSNIFLNNKHQLIILDKSLINQGDRLEVLMYLSLDLILRTMKTNNIKGKNHLNMLNNRLSQIMHLIKPYLVLIIALIIIYIYRIQI